MTIPLQRAADGAWVRLGGVDCIAGPSVFPADPEMLAVVDDRTPHNPPDVNADPCGDDDGDHVRNLTEELANNVRAFVNQWCEIRQPE